MKAWDKEGVTRRDVVKQTNEQSRAAASCKVGRAGKELLFSSRSFLCSGNKTAHLEKGTPRAPRKLDGLGRLGQGAGRVQKALEGEDAELDAAASVSALFRLFWPPISRAGSTGRQTCFNGDPAPSRRTVISRVAAGGCGREDWQEGLLVSSRPVLRDEI